MKTSNAIILFTSIVVVGGLGALLLFKKKTPLQPIGGTPPPRPPAATTPDPVAPEPVVPVVPQISESDKYDKKIDGAAGMLYEALNGIDFSGAGEEQFWTVTRALDKDEREDVADVYDDDWGNLCWDIEGDFYGNDEIRALKKYGYPSGNYYYSNC